MSISKSTIAALLVAAVAVSSCFSAKDLRKADLSVVKHVSAPAVAEDSLAYVTGMEMGLQLISQLGKDAPVDQMLSGLFQMLNSGFDPEDKDFDIRDSSFLAQFKVNPMSEEFGKTAREYQMRKSEEARKKAEEERAIQAAENSEKGQKFLDENKDKDGVVVSESGLQYIILEPGNAKRAGENDKVNVKYKGTHLDGTVFDDSGDQTRSFTRSGVVKGFGEGLGLIGEGGHIQLFIPGELAYGDRGSYSIGPNETLIFDVTLESIEPATK